MFTIKNRIKSLLESSNSEVKSIVEKSLGKLGDSMMNEMSLKHLSSIVINDVYDSVKDFKDDKIVESFLVKEDKLKKIKNLGIKEISKSILESEYNPQIKNSFSHFQYIVDEYKVYEQFLTLLRNNIFDGVVNEKIKTFETNVTENQNLINFVRIVENLQGDVNSAFIYDTAKEEIENYFIENTDSYRIKLIETLSPYKFNNNVVQLISNMNENSNLFQLKNASNKVNVKEIYSPHILENNTVKFFIKDTGFFNYDIKVGSIKRVDEAEFKTLPKWFVDLSMFTNGENVFVSENYAKIFAGDKKIEISKIDEKNVIKINGNTVNSISDFNRMYNNSGIFHRNEVDTIKQFVNLHEHFDNFIHIDFAKKIEDGINKDKFAIVFKTDENVFIAKVDKFNGINEFNNSNGLNSRQEMLEFLNYDLGKTFEDLLETEEKQIKELKAQRKDIEEQIKKYENQRDELRSLDEGAEYTSEIDGIVSLIESELTELKSKKSKIAVSIDRIKNGVNESKVIEVTENKVRGDVISKTILFDDDTSFDIDIDSNDIIDMDGMSVVPEDKIKKAEKKLNIKIKK